MAISRDVISERTGILLFGSGVKAEGSGRGLRHSAFVEPLDLNGTIKRRIDPLRGVRSWALRSNEAKAQVIELGSRHRLPMRGHHLREVFGKGVGLLLEQVKRGTDGTQLSFINDKG